MMGKTARIQAACWLVAALLLLMLCVLSFGPACWASSRAGRGGALVNTLYQPLLRLGASQVEPFATALEHYAELGSAAYWRITVTIDEITNEPGPAAWEFRQQCA